MSFKAHQTSRVSEQTRGASVRSPWDSLRSLRMFGYYKNQLTDQDHMRLSVSWGCFLCLPGLRQNLRQTSTEKKTHDRRQTSNSVVWESHLYEEIGGLKSHSEKLSLLLTE